MHPIHITLQRRSLQKDACQSDLGNDFTYSFENEKPDVEAEFPEFRICQSGQAVVAKRS